MSSSPVPVLCLYTLRAGADAEFLRLLDRHWPTLHASGLASDTPARVRRSKTRAGETVIVEEFEWKDERSSGAAHQTPAVMAVWEPLGALCTDMKFFHLEPV